MTFLNTQTYSERFSLIKLTKIMFRRGKFTGFSLHGYKEGGDAPPHLV